MEYLHLPGGDLIARGLADQAQGLETTEALLVATGAYRLNAAGIAAQSMPQSENRLYAMLAADNPNAAHSRYNAMIRKLVSFERALECASH